MREKIGRVWSIWPASLILIISIPWHRTPEIRNAITGAVEPDFSIQIAVWRILLEPWIGPLVFYLRSNKPFAEIFWLLIWAIPSFFLYQGIRKHLRIIDTLSKLPLFFIFFTAILLICLFILTPGQIIKPLSSDILLLNTHSHSFFSHDGMRSPRALLSWHRQNGFHAFFLTEHNQHQTTLQLALRQKNGFLSPQPKLLVGQEYSGSNHILLLGLTRLFNSKDMPDRVAIDSCHQQGGAVILPHWFIPSKNSRPLDYYIKAGIDGCEIVNQGKGFSYPAEPIRKIRQAANEHNLLLTGACDYHGFGPASFTWNALTIPGWRNSSDEQLVFKVLQIMRNHDQSKWQVLYYSDRPLLPAFVVPWSNLLFYFRTLSAWQVFSWLAWLVIANIFINLHLQKIFKLPILLTANAIITLFGLYFFIQGWSIHQYNDIMASIGLWIIILAFLFWFYYFRLNISKKIE